MFFCHGVSDQAGKDHHLGGHTYHLDLSAQLFPCRVKIAVSDLNVGRAWSPANYLSDPRSACSAEALAFPADKQWASDMFGDYRGDLTSERPTVEKPLLKITADLALSGYPARGTLTWSEPQAAHVRITARFLPAILARGWVGGGRKRFVANCMASSKRRNSISARSAQGSWNTRYDWYKRIRATKSDHGNAAPSGRVALGSRGEIAPVCSRPFRPSDLTHRISTPLAM